METSLKLLKEYGITAVMAFGLLYLNSRLNVVEDRLYQCYEARILNSFNQLEDRPIINKRIYAILPNELRIKNDDKRKNNKG